MSRITIGRMQNPVRGLLHGSAAVAAVAGLAILVGRAGGEVTAITGSLVFGLALIAMYTVSTIYHSVPWSDRWRARVQRLDHSMIFLVVAGTFTPIALAALEGTSLVVGLTSIWVIALAGILLKTILPRVLTHLSVTLQMVMGWSALIWMPKVWDRLGAGAVLLIGVGGLAYTTGVIVFASRRPRLFPRIFSHHELFHLLVVAGSTFHFLAVLNYALPATV